jgi:hypothetical protein
VNKKQILLPLAAILIAAALVAIKRGRDLHNVYLLAKTEEIGRDLIHETNSPLVVVIGPNLQVRLRAVLSSPTTIERVEIGDEPEIGDGRADSRLYLVNHRMERIGIRLRQDPKSDQFHVLGFWTPRVPEAK